MANLTTNALPSADGRTHSKYPNGGAPEGILLASYDFLTTFPDPAQYSSQAGGSITEMTEGTGESEVGFIRMAYPIDVSGDDSGALYNLLDVSALGATALEVSFRMRMPTAYKWGIKMFKIFGIRDGINYTNSTWAFLYPFAQMQSTSFSDGTTVSNDQAQAIRLDGNNRDWLGRNYVGGTAPNDLIAGAVVNTPQNADWFIDDEDWHDYVIRYKANTGTTAENEVNDGEYFISVDGNVYVDAAGLFNRHYTNGAIDSMHFGDWSQGADQAFDADFTDIIVRDMS